MVQYRMCPGLIFGLLPINPVEVIDEHLFLLVGRFVPTKVNRVHNMINLGLMINTDKLFA